MKLDADTLAAGYQALFNPITRAAHRACLEHAMLTRDNGWPTVKTCLAFAAIYAVPGAELAAFFGFLCYGESGRTVWVDALRGPVSSHVARQGATSGQAVAFGFQCAFADVFSPAGRA